MTRNATRAIAMLLGPMNCILGFAARGDIVEYREKQDWEAAVGEFTTIGFADLPDGTWVTEQYAHLGVHFVDGWDQVVYGASFLEDGAGLVGGEQIDIVFDAPVYWIATDFPGGLAIDLYFNGQLFYQSGYFGPSGLGNFGGLVSTEPFDRALIWDYDVNVAIDDLHFGPPIPAPCAMPFIGGALLAARRRRRA
jgi:hypothetical protein